MAAARPLNNLMSMSKKTLAALAVLAGALSLQFPILAAEVPAPTQSAAEHRAALRERLQATARNLNLTAEQKQELRSTMREHLTKLRELRQDNNLSPQEKREKFQAIRNEIAAEVKKVLTPEQFEKWKETRSELSRQGPRPPARLQEAIKELNLSEQQKEQLKPLYREQMEKLRELRQDANLSQAQKLEKLKAINQEIAPKVRKVLDAEQYAKWEKDVDQWLTQLQQRLSRGAGPRQ